MEIKLKNTDKYLTKISKYVTFIWFAGILWAYIIKVLELPLAVLWCLIGSMFIIEMTTIIIETVKDALVDILHAAQETIMPGVELKHIELKEN